MCLVCGLWGVEKKVEIKDSGHSPSQPWQPRRLPPWRKKGPPGRGGSSVCRGSQVVCSERKGCPSAGHCMPWGFWGLAREKIAEAAKPNRQPKPRHTYTHTASEGIASRGRVQQRKGAASSAVFFWCILPCCCSSSLFLAPNSRPPPLPSLPPVLPTLIGQAHGCDAR